MSSGMSIGGLISGIDTNTMLDQLYQVAQGPILRLRSKKDALGEQSAAWSQLEANLLSFRTVATRLASPAGFECYTAALSKPDLATASAGASAVPGSYSFTVQALARTHQLASQGYADTNQTEVGAGTISISVGDGDPVVIEVENYTLGELRDAINDAEAGVTATIVNDGSGASPYRLVLTSETSGLAGEVEVTVDLVGGTAPTLTELQAAQDAQIQLGSGAGAVTVYSSTNTFANVIQGVTLTVLEADPATAVTLTVSRDTTTIRGVIEDLAARYNEIADFFAEQFAFDAETSKTGTLFGDYRLQTLQQDISSALGGRVIGLTGEYASLSGLGIRTDLAGKLTVDSAALAAALTDHLDEVVGVFAAAGRTTHAAVSYLTGSTETQPSGATGWAVEITQAATRSRVTAGVEQTAPLAANETLTINGVNIELTAGMTQSQVIAAINAEQAQTGMTASATDANGGGSGNYLTLTRVAYGSAFHVTGGSSESNQGGPGSSGIGTTTVSDDNPQGESGTGTGGTGLDVEGTIGGYTCSGSGQRLAAEEGDTEGLSLLVKATSAGSYGDVFFTVGAAEAAFRVCLEATDTVDGTIARTQDYIDDSMSDLEAEITRIQTLVEQQQERLRLSFAGMEQALAQFQSQSQFLSSYMAQIQANAPKS